MQKKVSEFNSDVTCSDIDSNVSVIREGNLKNEYNTKNESSTFHTIENNDENEMYSRKAGLRERNIIIK